MTREEFLDWKGDGDTRYEFDGFEPVAMVGGVANHSLIAQNLYFALRSRLGRGPCRVMGPDAGVATAGDAVRFPDALVTCSPVSGSDRLIPGVVVVFEVLSPSSGRIDRIEKVREYRAVASIRCYVILENTSAAATLLTRADVSANWTANALTASDMLALPDIGLQIPLAEIYQDIEFL